ncbi:hypothetical protein I317_05329 [Kwoniella heveanensis CBS 569]|nr:hypothetical protein I317_05329 [Kwoniella heveanensis CBS 569]
MGPSVPPEPGRRPLANRSASCPQPAVIPQLSGCDHIGPTLDHPSSIPNEAPSAPQTSAVSRQGPIFQSFQPSAGTGSDEQIPAEWSDMDFSWILDDVQIAGDKEDLSTPLDDATRLHCLWLFFTNQSASGLEMNIARFHERLESSNEEDRPHPALLNAIASPIQSVRMREQYFLRNVEVSLQEAFREQKRLPKIMLDLLRAEILLAEYMWTYAREAEVKPTRIALAACFDQIPSSSDVTPSKVTHLRLKRNPLFLPPNDAIDIADRVYAFWSFVLLDICASVASKMPINIDLFTIKTPLPKPWNAYMGPTSDLQSDRRLTDIFRPNPPPIQSDFGYIIQATFLLHVASLQLLERFPLADQESSTSPVETSLNGSWAMQRSNQSISRKDLSTAVDRLVQETPDRLRWKGVRTAQGLTTPLSAISLYFIVCSTRIHIADTNTYQVSNDSAMYHVRRMIDSIRLLEPAQNAQLGLAIYILWDLAALVLLREIKRLRRQGDDIAFEKVIAKVDSLDLAVVTLEADLDFLIGTLTVLSIDRPLLLEEVQGLARLRDSPPSDVDPDDDGMRDDEPTSENNPSSVSAALLTTP